MASIRKRGNSYQITVSNGYDVDGKKISATATFTPEPGMKKKELDIALKGFALDFEREVKAGKNIQGGRITFKTLSELYLRDMKPPVLARTTYKDYNDRLQNRIIPAMGHIKIENIRKKDVNNYEKMLRNVYRNPQNGKPLADSSIKKDCAVISSLLSYAANEGMLDINMLIYAGKSKKGKNKGAKTAPVKYFTTEQLIRFIDALEHPMNVMHQEHFSHVNGMEYAVRPYFQTFQLSVKWKLYFYIAIFSGDRRGENISLTWKDLNLKTGQLFIRTSTDYVDGVMELKDTKTHNERENILPSYVVDIAKMWKKEQMQQCLKYGNNWEGFSGKEFENNYIFTQKNGKQMHICSPYTKYKRIIKIYNSSVAKNDNEKIPEDVPVHGLRHSAAAIMIANNLDARTVANILGHSNPTTTLNIYSYFFKSKGVEASQIMEQVLISDKIVVK